MTVEALLTTRQVEIIRKKEFATTALDADNKTFVLYLKILAKPTIMPIYSLLETPVTLLINIEIFAKYFDFLDIFSSNSAVELLEYTRINNYPINLLKDKQLLYSLIYNLELVELEILKTYIKANLASSFIRSLKSFIGA